MKFIIYNTIKITIGFVVAILIANWLKLEFVTSAGVITLLSMLDTKRKFLKIAFKRIYTAVIALAIASFFFRFIGFNPLSLGLYLLLYIPIVYLLKSNVALVVNTVLVTHIYTVSQISFNHIINELALMLIGIAIALILNIHMPNIEGDIRKLQYKLEAEMKIVLKKMAENLNNYCSLEGENVTLQDLKKTINLGKEKAYNYLNNYYLKENSYFLEYFQMRNQQYHRLKYMENHFNHVFITKEEASIISQFTQRISDSLHECNTGESLLDEIQRLKEGFRESDLPKTRTEFENRASLFQYLNDLEEYVLIKNRFIEKYGIIKYCAREE